MGIPFRSPPKSFAADPPDTPYQRAAQEWDRRMGLAVRAAETWRAVSLGAGVLALALGAGLTIVALQQRTFVHVVEVSPEGSVLSVEPANATYTPTDAQVSYFLGHFVRLVRAVPTDAVVLRENWLEAYQYLTPQSAQILNEQARDEDPFSLVGQRARSIMVRSIVQRSPATWQVSWIEATSSGGGARGQRALYTGLFTTTQHPQHRAAALARNPLGLFITDFSWSLETPATSNEQGGAP